MLPCRVSLSWMNPYWVPARTGGLCTPFQQVTAGCGCFLSNPMTCPFSAGYRGAVPGAGPGEEERCHRTHPGNMTGPCFPVALVCVGTAPCQAPQQPEVPQTGEKASLHCCLWHQVGWETASLKIRAKGS